MLNNNVTIITNKIKKINFKIIPYFVISMSNTHYCLFLDEILSISKTVVTIN